MFALRQQKMKKAAFFKTTFPYEQSMNFCSADPLSYGTWFNFPGPAAACL
jgi:hypothetical protein